VTKPIIAGLLLCAIVMLVAHLESKFAPIEQAVSDEQMRHVLRACDATITDGEHYDAMPSPRCYFFKSVR
jgi:hypothetical protein